MKVGQEPEDAGGSVTEQLCVPGQSHFLLWLCFPDLYMRWHDLNQPFIECSECSRCLDDTKKCQLQMWRANVGEGHWWEDQ